MQQKWSSRKMGAYTKWRLMARPGFLRKRSSLRPVLLQNGWDCLLKKNITGSEYLLVLLAMDFSLMVKMCRLEVPVIRRRKKQHTSLSYAEKCICLFAVTNSAIPKQWYIA